MKKSLKKMLTSVLTVAMIFTSFMVFSVPVLAEEEATAYLSFAAEDWGLQYWNDENDYAPVIAETQPVTGYGQYSTSLDFTETEAGFATGIAFLDVEVSNGEALYPNSYMAIDSLKINGEDVEIGKTYTSTDDDIATRTNLYNEWVTDVEKGRTADGDVTDLSAIVFDKTLYPEIKTIEVTFTIGDGVAFGDTDEADTDEAEADVTETAELPAEGTTAYLAMADNSWSVQYWFDGNDYAPVVANNATVTGYGQYTVSLDFTGVDGGVCPDIVFMDVEVAGGEQYFPNSYMQIDSMKINGEEVPLGNTYTSTDDDIATRTNLFNTWVAEVEEGRTNGLELSEVTATPLDGAAYTNIETVEVTFTLVEGEAVVEEVVEEEYVMPTEFNAFMMFSDVSGAWETYEAGVSGDTVVLGDGVYTVYVKGSDIGATGQATEGQVFLIDIEGLGEAMVHLGTLREDEEDALTETDATASVKVFVDGVEVNSKSKNILMGDLEGNGKLRLELYNVWGSGTAENPVVMGNFLTPADEIKVEFTLEGTGLNTGAIIEEPVKDDDTTEAKTETDAETDVVTADTTDNDGISSIVVIVVVLVVVLSGGAYFVYKKRK